MAVNAHVLAGECHVIWLESTYFACMHTVTLQIELYVTYYTYVTIRKKHTLFDVKGITQCYDHQFVISLSTVDDNN